MEEEIVNAAGEALGEGTPVVESGAGSPDALREERAREIEARWQSEAGETAEAFPGFELGQELRNPVFRSLLVHGVPVKAAYTALHADEVISRALEAGVATAGEKLTRSVISGQTRPLESAAGHGSHGSPLRDILNMSGRQMEDLIARAARGEEIVL